MSNRVSNHLLRIHIRVQQAVNNVIRGERGDVPGWVLVTVMTAGLVVAIWSVAGTQLKTVLTNALRSVTAP